MGKVIRVRSKGVANYVGPETFPLMPVEAQLWLWFRASAEVTVWADFENGISIPLYTGLCLDQKYHMEGDVKSIRLSCAKTTAYAIRFWQENSRYKDVSDPVPHRAIVPVDMAADTMENRILRAVDSALASRGLTASRSRGVSYDDSDEEFGEGYQYDEEVDEEIDAAAARAVAKRFAPDSGSKRVQSAGDDDKDEPAGSKLGVQKSDRNQSAKQSSDANDNGE